ncbi:MAG: FIST C-terminal domain-containing protein [Planctomycetes bacterium]|nr:FIST C-terminal domain-containing protein [Planctomycetota bacterium]
MRWYSAVSEEIGPSAAVKECVAQLRLGLGDARPDVLFAFVSSFYQEAYPLLAAALREQLKPAHLLGCTAGGVLGSGREIEDAPGLALAAAVMPGVEIHPFHFRNDELPDLDGGPRAWEQAVGVKAAAQPEFVVLADPWSIRAEELLSGLDFAFPNSAKIGGLASGARQPGHNVLWLDDVDHLQGAAGLAFTGNVRIQPLVAQGCKPLGKPMRITDAEKNVLYALDGKPVMEVLAELVESSSADDRELIRTALFLGIVMDPLKSGAPGAGDFLIRNPLGREPSRDGLVVGALLRKGMTVQFHVRDANAARADLAAVLRGYTTALLQEGRGEALSQPPAGALLFSCLGRGQHMYGEKDHDSKAFHALVGDVPLAGFFCNGEIGPVGGTTYVHGFTSCFGCFRAKS